MYARVYGWTMLLILLELADAMSDREAGAMDAAFRQRTRADWEKVWHHESHTRCRDKLLRHLFWACDNDIYRLARKRSGGITAAAAAALDGNGEQQRLANDVDAHAELKQSYSSGWLDPQIATQMLRSRRSRRRSTPPPSSITAECCTRTGCTWEEYAEYCPSNKRQAEM